MQFVKKNFDVLLSEEAEEFIRSLNSKVQKKVIYNIQKSRQVNDSKLLKKVSNEIWEFRTRYGKTQIRMLAFWDTNTKALIICSHGFVKKTSKVPKAEMDKVLRYRNEYLNR